MRWGAEIRRDPPNLTPGCVYTVVDWYILFVCVRVHAYGQ